MKSNRMFGILCLLLEREKMTAQELADYFEVSVRTIHRDLLDLSGAGFPVTTQQGIGGGISLLPNFKYSKSVLSKEDMDLIISGIQGFSSIDDSAKIKTLLAKLRLVQEDKLLLENDIIIDFTSWNHRSMTIEKIKVIRSAIASHRLLDMEYYSSKGYSQRIVEPYKLIFKEEYWYLFAYCTQRQDFRVFKINRILNLCLCEQTFVERSDYEIPVFHSAFSNSKGEYVTVKMDKSYEFLALDFFGQNNIKEVGNSLYISFYTEYPQWVITTFASLGDKAEIIEPKSLRDEIRTFLTGQKSNMKVDTLLSYLSSIIRNTKANCGGKYMKAEIPYSSDIAEIISHRHDNGADFWTTTDHKLLKGAPYTTLESALYLLELGVPADDEILKGVAALIFENWKEDGKIRTSPSGGIYPCQTALAVKVLCRLGYSDDDRVKKSFSYFLDTQQQDGGWKCNKYSFGKGEETEYSTPYTTLLVLDLLRYSPFFNCDSRLDRAVDFLLEHWVIRKPISPCHYGIGTLFMQLEYPFRGYNLFYYVYILSFYRCAKSDRRFLEALEHIKAKTIDGQIPVERVVPKLSKLSFCQKGRTSELATLRYREILHNLSREGLQER